MDDDRNLHSTAGDRFDLPALFRRVRLVAIRPEGYAHTAVFDDLVTGLSSALSALGCASDVSAHGDGVDLVVGAHLLDASVDLPSHAVVFNLEPASALANNQAYLERLRRNAVLDYSARNASWIRSETGNAHVQVLGIGYRPELSRISSAPEQDVDVLFYGSVNVRRQLVLDELAAAGLKVKALFGVYGAERDHWIARSKLVLNLHLFPDQVHEIVRSSYLLANRKAVVCECDEATEIDPDLREAMVCVPAAHLVEACVELVRDEAGRRVLEQRGFETFSRRDQARMLAEALAKLARPLPARINLGGGVHWRDDALNVDADAGPIADLVCDLAAPDAFTRVYFSRRFGLLRLDPGSFEEIETRHVLERVPDLVGLMTRSLELLRVGGEMHNIVSYDLSYGAWQDPAHVRAFNERSWQCYTDAPERLGWRVACFDLVRNEMVLSPLGEELRAAGTPDEQIFRTPRAVDSMRAVLRKRVLETRGESQAEDEGALGTERSSVALAARGRPRICLSMIVKNEAHVIERCLGSVLPYIDAWAICDTGSTDGTQERIRTLLADLPGELLERPWVDFAHNRNEALQLAHGYGEYALVIDADDVFEAEPGFQWGALGAPGYLFEIVFGDDQAFWRVALMRLGLDWVWEGVIHEVPVCSQLGEVMQTKLRGPRIRIVGGGARSRQSLQEKYLKDVEVLRRALADLPDNPRYTFYLAQGLNESGQLREALEAYQRRVEIGGWFEEVYYSKLQIASLQERTGASHSAVVAAYLDAYEYRPQRAESLCELARYLRTKERYAAAYSFARIACSIRQPEDLVIVDTGVYRWRARDELAIACFFLGDYATCAQLYEDILAVPVLPAADRERMRENLESARALLRETGGTEAAIV
jgi:tetratricopeptide (TPR) repeat protein